MPLTAGTPASTGGVLTRPTGGPRRFPDGTRWGRTDPCRRVPSRAPSWLRPQYGEGRVRVAWTRRRTHWPRSAARPDVSKVMAAIRADRDYAGAQSDVRKRRRAMQRRGFLALGGLAAGAALLPPLAYGRAIAAERLLERIDGAIKRRLADAALQAATDAGASYCDIRIGRYLRQSLLTREARVENVANEESVGAGVRVVAGGAWGFAATNRLDVDAVARAARQAVAIARANARVQAEPVRLAPAPAHGEVSWRTPI